MHECGRYPYDGDFADVTVEYDLNGDGVADGEVDVDRDGGFRLSPAGLSSVDSTGLVPGQFAHQVRLRAVAPDLSATPPEFEDGLLGTNANGDATAGWYAGDYFAGAASGEWGDSVNDE
ncbi:MAG: hypothetical protein AAGB00_06665, partial [Planctomycetota bacterium]